MGTHGCVQRVGTSQHGSMKGHQTSGNRSTLLHRAHTGESAHSHAPRRPTAAVPTCVSSRVCASTEYGILSNQPRNT